MEPQDQAHQPSGAHSRNSTPDPDRDPVVAVAGAMSDHQGHGLLLTKDPREADPASLSTPPPIATNSKIPPSNSAALASASASATTPSPRTPSSSLPTPSSSSSPLPPRLPGTPPANPPPRFFTRPYRRAVDHHHPSVHGSGHSTGQNSSSIGVRSAFKDFVVPAQIILVCSILNALWPTLLRIITTAIEFLVLVLSSYSACARRSDDCYFLEPLFHDGQEAVYVGTIQWTLRGVFCILFFSALYFVSQKVQKIWFTLMSNRQRPRSFWSPENLCYLLMKYPNMLWRYISKKFPWKINRRSYGQSGQSRSGQSTRHQRRKSSLSTDQYQFPLKSRANSLSMGHGYSKKTGTSSAVDTDGFSAGSGSESKVRSKAKSRKSKVPEEALLRDGYQRSAVSNSVPLNRSPSGSTVIASAPSTPTLPSETSSRPVGASVAAIDESNLSTADTAAGTVYETADDGDFISTDRRRRRKAKGYKANPATTSSESLVKPATPLSRDQEPASSNTDTAPQLSHPVSPAIEVKKAPPPSAQSETRPQDTVVVQKQNSLREWTYHQPAIPSQDSTQLEPKTKTTPPTTASALNNNTNALLQPTQDNAFVHPLHALNSTSPIVRLKPSHKRSQSAQLPSSSPWSIPQPSLFNGKWDHGSSLLPSDSATPTFSTGSFNDFTSAAPSSSEQTDSVSSKGKAYDLFGQSSIWYSPFQSGLDISIESDHEQGKHGSRLLSKPKIHIDSVGTQRRLNLGPMLPPSSFFASSPIAPKILPFSQRRNGGSWGLEDRSVRTRSSSITVPMTPLLESDCLDPMDYFSSSRSASSSRRGSVENNLTESLLSGRARMFASSEAVAVHPRQSSQHSSVSSEGFGGSAAEPSFLSPQYTSPITPNTSAVLSSSDSPVLGQAPLDLAPSTATSFSSVVGDPISTFVNPWESNYPYRSNHTMSETFLPFRASLALNAADTGINRDRQSSLLRLMNGDSGIGGSDHGDTLFGTLERDDEGEAIRRGFLFPSLAHHSHVSLHSTELTSFSPFASVEMSLAAAANQPPPLTDNPKYDFVELPIPNQTLIMENTQGSSRNEASEKRPKDRHRHGRSRSGHHKSASLSSFFPPMPSTPGVSDSTGPGIQANSGGTLDPLNRLAHNANGEGRSSGSQGHGYSRQSRNQGSATGKESDGMASTSGRRRAGTVQDNHQHRGVSKHHNHPHDSSKSKRTPKKEQHAS